MKRNGAIPHPSKQNHHLSARDPEGPQWHAGARFGQKSRMEITGKEGESKQDPPTKGRKGRRDGSFDNRRIETALDPERVGSATQPGITVPLPSVRIHPVSLATDKHCGPVPRRPPSRAVFFFPPNFHLRFDPCEGELQWSSCIDYLGKSRHPREPPTVTLAQVTAKKQRSKDGEERTLRASLELAWARLSSWAAELSTGWTPSLATTITMQYLFRGWLGLRFRTACALSSSLVGKPGEEAPVQGNFI